MVQKGTSNTASQRSLGVKFREGNKTGGLSRAQAVRQQTPPQVTALMCSAIQQVMAPPLSLICRSTGWNCLPQKKIKGLYETEVKAELFEFPPTGHTCQNFQAIKMSENMSEAKDLHL